MDSLTGRKRRNSSEDVSSTSSSSCTRSRFVTQVVASSGGKEFVPELYKSISTKRFRAEQPENNEERQLIASLPSDTESALQLIRTLFPSQIFEGRLPPIILYSQLSSIISNQFIIDSQLSKLAKENKILTFSTFTSSNYLIVFLEDFIGLKTHKDVEIFNRFVTQVVAASTNDDDNRSLENSKYFSKESLRKRWKFEEDDIRKLVNAGYLGIQEGGMYCISLPRAGEFVKCLLKGKKAVLGAIRRGKFGEILQSELEQRPMKKSVPLGVVYHIYELIGSGEVVKVDTTSGPLLRVKKKT